MKRPRPLQAAPRGPQLESQMITAIEGLHHVTSMVRDAAANNRFYTETLGLRRVKKTVNFDAPDVYHLYYGDAAGTPGSVMTSFPFPDIGPGRQGTGEVGTTAFAVPAGTLDWWQARLAAAGAKGMLRHDAFGEARLFLRGPDSEGLSLVEAPGDDRTPWTKGGVGAEHAIRGFHSVALRLRDTTPTGELLAYMGYEQVAAEGKLTRYVRPGGNGANVIDLEALPGSPPARAGAGSVHHIAFAVPDRAAQAEVRKALADAGLQVTPPIDRDYFWAIYFQTPGGVLFEVATDEPGFARDEDPAHLGEALKLPERHEHLRSWLEANLSPIGG
jgi:glyoxalase family protein